MENDEQLIEVKKIVEVKLGLYVHATVYALVNGGLIAVNLATKPQHLWFQWPLIGWGAGLALHAGLALAFMRGGSIKKRMIERELQKRAMVNHSSS